MAKPCVLALLHFCGMAVNARLREFRDDENFGKERGGESVMRCTSMPGFLSRWKAFKIEFRITTKSEAAMKQPVHQQY